MRAQLRREWWTVQVLTAALLLLVPLCGRADVEITLRNDFIEQYKDRATIDLKAFIVNVAHPKPNSPKKDGDLHVAGRSTEVGLAIVAEIMNAKFEDDAVDKIHDVEGTNQAIPLSGAWRLWCEHSEAGSEHKQDAPIPQYKNANPDHVFEVHPVTAVDGISTRKSLKPVKGFEKVLRKAGRTATAFGEYNDKFCELRPGKDTTTIVTRNARYNYVEFVLELHAKPAKLSDGRAAHADVFDLDDEEDEPLARKIRMVFIKDTAPEKRAKGLAKGDRLRVIGVPRISLRGVAERVELSAKKKDALRWPLPYEMIIVAVVAAEDEEKCGWANWANDAILTQMTLQRFHCRFLSVP